MATNEVENGHNIYSRIVTKRKKGSSFFYSLLNTHAKRDGWAQCRTKLESDSLDLGLTWSCSEHDVVTRVRQVNKTRYFNRLKQFYLRLMRNNLYLGKTSNANNMCFICDKHPERRFPVMFSCEPVRVLTAKVIQILKSAGLLRLGDNIEMFLFSEYTFDTVENWVLITLWDYLYKLRFCPEKYSICMFTKYLKIKVDHFSIVSPRLKLGSYLLSSALSNYNNDVLHDV